METPVDWLPPILMLVGGLVAGIIVAIIVSRRGRSAPQAGKAGAPTEEPPSELQLELRDLDAKKEALIGQLREMEDTAAKRDPSQLAVERYEVELQTAQVLREIDELTGEMRAPAAERRARGEDAPAEPTEAPTGPPSGMKGFVWGVASAAAIGALVVYVGNSASQRGEGGSLTGGPQMGGTTTAAPAPDPALQRAIAAVNANPDNLDNRVALAYEYLLREDFMNTFEQTQIVLQRNPDEPNALTYQALVRLAMGQSEMAETMLVRASSIDPDLIEARVYLALAYAETGRFDDALAQIDEAKTRHPDQASRLDQIVAEIEMRRLNAGDNPPPPRSEEDPHASLLPPPGEMGGAPSAAPAAPVAAGPGSVTGTIELADGVEVRAGLPVFIIVRDAGAEGGTPVAVSRLTARSFPMPFSVSGANSMMGDDLPDRMRIEIRVDLDGNAMTRDAGAPEGVADDVATGTSGVTVVLK